MTQVGRCRIFGAGVASAIALGLLLLCGRCFDLPSDLRLNHVFEQPSIHNFSFPVSPSAASCTAQSVSVLLCPPSSSCILSQWPHHNMELKCQYHTVANSCKAQPCACIDLSVVSNPFACADRYWFLLLCWSDLPLNGHIVFVWLIDP